MWFPTSLPAVLKCSVLSNPAWIGCGSIDGALLMADAEEKAAKKGLISLPSLKLTFFLHLKKWMVGISEYQFSFWDGLFSGAMLVCGPYSILDPWNLGIKKGPMTPAILSQHRFNSIINLTGLQGVEYPPFPNIAKKVQKFIKLSSYQGHIGVM